MIAIEFENISKQYRLGLVSTGTLSHDLNRFWQTKILQKEDPYLKVGEVNDRAHKGKSDYVWALKDINFKVEEGDVVGIIGRNGAGKSTLLKLLSRVTAPTTGIIRARGRIASLLEEHLHERRHHGNEPRRDYLQARRDRGLQRIRTLPGHSRKTLQQLSRSSQNQYRHRKILK